MAAKGNVPHDDFKSGFQVGYQAVMGIRRIVPVPPIKPITKIGMTPLPNGADRKRCEQNENMLSGDIFQEPIRPCRSPLSAQLN